MITIIHGEDIAKSRTYFIEQRHLYINPVIINGQTISLTEIIQIFEGNELFSTEKYIFIEDFFSKRKKSKETEQIITTINQNQSGSIIVFWESKELTHAQLNNLPAGKQVKQFKLPQNLFAFLDAIKPNNGKTLVRLFHHALVDEDAQFLFVMLIRQMRLLLAVSESAEHPIEELKRMAPWQKGKLQKQAFLFLTPQIRNAYSRLYHMEYGMKTGTLSLPLEQAIDFFLMEL